MFPGENTWRAIHGDGDGLPGLVVDRYGDYLSVQFLIPAMEQRRDLLVPLLVEQFACKGIMNRSDAGVRALEGLAQEKGLLWGEVPDPVVIREGQLELAVSLEHGQKTGQLPRPARESRGGGALCPRAARSTASATSAASRCRWRAGRSG